MKLSTVSRLTGVGILTAALVAGAATAASAADQSNGSDGPMYVYDVNTATLIDSSTVLAFNDQVSGSPSKTDAYAPYQCPMNSTSARTFIAPVGKERTPTAWTAYADNFFDPTTKELLAPSIGLEEQVLGSQAAVKAAGGTWSVGFACLINNGVAVADPNEGAFWLTATITAGTGAWTAKAPDAGTTPTDPPVDPTDPNLTGTIDLEAATISSAVDGDLSLSVPANAKVVFEAATVVDGKSTSKGTLPNVTVQDDRAASRPGWVLTSKVDPFVNAADSSAVIEEKQLGLAPKVVSTTSPGAVAGATQTAGTAVYPSTLASAPAGSGTGTTVLSGDLTFVAPADKPVGTYTSKMTLTLVGN